ncbi:MAG TPA: aspartate-alanine antiporter [Usitatibacter sp.]|jgi:putative transport protein|nr:aspartate-alanine antiporter [Usitatibacter sp.]
MEWLARNLQKYPELAVFLVVGLGYWIGAIKVRGFGLGAVTGSLIVGLVAGYFVAIPVSGTAKSILFLLFLFSIGYSVGPRFFAAMKGDGLRWAALGVTVTVSGLLVSWAVARFLHLDPGMAAGLLSGGLTQSATIGTASEAIRSLPIALAEQDRLVAHVAVADALCYVFGALGVIVFCSHVGPKLLGIDLAEEARKVEAELGIDREKAGVVSAWQPFEMRAYRLENGVKAIGKTVASAESLLPEARLFIERIRRGAGIIAATPQTVLEEGDVIVASGRREVLVETLGRSAAREIEDRELLDLPVATYDIFVSGREVVGRTLADIAKTLGDVRGVFLLEIVRAGIKVPVGAGTVLERGDVLRVMGPEPAVLRAESVIGRTVYPSETTDFVALGLAICIGALLGVLLVLPVGNLRIAIGTSVGTLLSGLVVGYLHSVRPLFGRIPEGAVSLMTSLGLASFVAMVGIGAGPHFVEALRQAGVGLLFGGVVVTLVPLFVGLYFGRYVLKLNPVLLLGGIAGAQTMTAAMAAVQERSGSPVAVLGYSGTVAIGHILLTTWGTVIVHLVA